MKKNKNRIQEKLFLNHLYKKNPFVLEKYSELENFLESDNFLKNCYINRKEIHQILYEEEELIQIQFNKYKFQNYVYLILLIEENRDILNYSYKIELINLINN